MEIERITLRYYGKLTPEIQNKIHGFLRGCGFEPYAVSTTQEQNGNGELKYFVICQDSSKSKLEEELKQFDLPLEILQKTGV